MLSLKEEEEIAAVESCVGDEMYCEPSTMYNSCSAAHTVKKPDGRVILIEDSALTGITGSTKVAKIPNFNKNTKSVIHVLCRTENETPTYSCKTGNVKSETSPDELSSADRDGNESISCDASGSDFDETLGDTENNDEK